jgi:hypothetical protein
MLCASEILFYGNDINLTYTDFRTIDQSQNQFDSSFLIDVSERTPLNIEYRNEEEMTLLSSEKKKGGGRLNLDINTARPLLNTM